MPKDNCKECGVELEVLLIAWGRGSVCLKCKPGRRARLFREWSEKYQGEWMERERRVFEEAFKKCPEVYDGRRLKDAISKYTRTRG